MIPYLFTPQHVYFIPDRPHLFTAFLPYIYIYIYRALCGCYDTKKNVRYNVALFRARYCVPSISVLLLLLRHHYLFPLMMIITINNTLIIYNTTTHIHQLPVPACTPLVSTRHHSFCNFYSLSTLNTLRSRVVLVLPRYSINITIIVDSSRKRRIIITIGIVLVLPF